VPLRYYQIEAIEAAEREFALGKQRVLVVAATGLGKTVLFNEVIRVHVERGERVLLLAHREELIRQAAVRLFLDTGLVAAVEMAKLKEGTAGRRAGGRQAALLEGIPEESLPSTAVGSWLDNAGHEHGVADVTRDERGRPLVVVASVQSLVRRLQHHASDAFDLVVIDEAHHAPADSYTAITDHFARARILGVTATPNRGDGVAMAKAFDVCAFSMPIVEGIEHGWLVPVRVRSIETSIDFAGIRTTAGDLNQKQLAEALSELGALHEIAGPIVEECGDRQTIVFAVTVAHAHLLAEVMREHVADRAKNLGRPAPGSSAVLALDGTAESDERRSTVDAFLRGECQYLVNCALFTEGFDAPPTAAIAMARPTKSLGLYLQMMGRGTRSLAGVADAMPAREQTDQRRAAIAASAKPDMVVLDFVGNAGKHAIVNALDALAGDGTPAEKSLAKKVLEEGVIDDVLAALAEARRRISEMEQQRLREQARRGYRATDMTPDGSAPAPRTPPKPIYDPAPFDLLGFRYPTNDGPPVSEKQWQRLKGLGIDARGMSSKTAANLLTALDHRRSKGLATFKQLRCLRKHAGRVVAVESLRVLTFKEAGTMMDELIDGNWVAPRSWALRFGRFRVEPASESLPPYGKDEIPFEVPR
jgi:superfamily II DNA or RNA helicase